MSAESPSLFPEMTDMALVDNTAASVVFDFMTMDLVVITAISVATEAISYITPAQACLNGDAFTLTVTGTLFTASAKVNFNGSQKFTVFVSATSLLAIIPVSDLLALGPQAITVVDGATTTNTNYLNVVVCPSPSAGHGPVLRPQYDHLADVRANDNQLNKLQDMIGTNDVLRRVSRQ